MQKACLVAGAILLATLLMIVVAEGSGVDPRCSGPARYEAMRAGSTCELPLGYSCNEIRQAVARFGRKASLNYAINHGASARQIKAAKRCLS